MTDQQGGNDKWYGTEEARKTKTMADFLRYLWQQERKPGSDLTINLSGSGGGTSADFKFEAHTLVMTCHSTYIARMLDNPEGPQDSQDNKMALAESYWSDQSDSRPIGGLEIILGAYTGITPGTLKSILRFAYTLETDHISADSAPAIWAGAEVLGMPHLQKVCLAKSPTCAAAGQALLDGAVPPENKVFAAPPPPPAPKEPTPPPPPVKVPTPPPAPKIVTPPPTKAVTPPPSAVPAAPSPAPPASPAPPTAPSPTPPSLQTQSSLDSSTTSTTPVPAPSPEPSSISVASAQSTESTPGVEAEPKVATPKTKGAGKKGGTPKEAKAGTPAKDGSTPAPKGKGKKDDKSGGEGASKKEGKGKKKK